MNVEKKKTKKDVFMLETLVSKHNEIKGSVWLKTEEKINVTKEWIK